MDWTDFFSALGLLLVLEGLLPFASPSRWRNMMRQLAESPEVNLRLVGAVSMVAGLLILYFARF